MAAIDPKLPAPKAPSVGGPPPASSLEFDDLPLGATPALGPSNDSIIDLPAPKRATQRLPLEPAREDVIDLPAPKAGRRTLDIPAPKLGPKRVTADLSKPRDPAVATPAPVPDLPALQKRPTIPDLSAPQKGPTIPDLPAPRMTDLQPKPHRNPDLPAPKGFFDDLPQPALGHDPDLPAPKGFFDDLPQPALGHDLDLPAPKGFFDDLPQVKSNPSGGGPEAPAPKGFFDNIPALPNTSKPEAPAPKGFFDNIPALPNTSKPEAPAPKGFFDNVPGRPLKQPNELAPKGFFDNVPGRPLKQPNELAPKGFFDNLPQRARPGQTVPGDQAAVDLVPVPTPALTPTGAGPDGETGPERDLVAPSSTGASSFDDLGPSGAFNPPIRFEHGPRVPPAPRVADDLPHGTDGISPELAGATPNAAGAMPVAKLPATAKPGLDEAAAATPRARRNKIAFGGVIAAVVLGGGGFALFQRHAEAQERAAAIAEQLDLARTSYAASDPQHWQRAATAARRVVKLDAENLEALGIGAEALFASALDDGTTAASKIGQARALLEAASGAAIASPLLTRARALSALAAHKPDGALALLQPLVTQAPKDGVLALYLGWAFEAKGDPASAIKSYDSATGTPAVKLAALYSRGNAKLALTDLDGARADFSAVLALAKDHVGAQVGLASAQPPSAAGQQEADLLAILARKDIAGADPRVVARAWTRAGEAALRAGHGEIARERFHKALGVVPQDLTAMTGLAEAELADGKLAAAAELIATALGVAKDNVPAQLVESEIELKQHKLPLAAQRLAALASHVIPLAPLEQARLHLLTGELHEAQGKDDDALDAYIQGAKLARELDLTPVMAAVKKLAAMTTAAVDAKDPQRADELRARGELLLGELAQHAEHEPQLAMTLGIAYLQAGDAAKAEPWLRRVAEARPSDAEARFQLGRALLAAGKHEEALVALSAANSFEPERGDIGAELARTYEALGRDLDAGELYAKLLAGKAASLELRTRAGRFFVRTGALDKAGEQGAKIVEVDPKNAAGLYLKGEGLLTAGKLLEAKQTLQRAVEIERDPQYLDALGRAAEALSQGGDRELQDLALSSYLAAVEAAPSTFNSLAGQGRLYVARHEAEKAVPPLLVAAGLEPRNPEVMFLIGAAYQELQKTTAALQWLGRSIKISPRAEAFWRIGQIYRDTNRGGRAAAAVGNATRLAAEDEKRTGAPIAWLTEALYFQGRINYDLHNEARARDAWAMYVARNPPSSAQLTEVQQLLATSLRR